MSRCLWPGSMLEEHNVPANIVVFFQTEYEDKERTLKEYADLKKDFRMLEETCARQDRYIAELEKQLILLQKTLDLVDKNGGEQDGRG